MQLIVIRHGQSEADVLRVHEGRADFALTQTGQAQATRLAGYLQQHYKIEKIYSSTLQRAVQTARHLSDAISRPVILDERLMEFDNGQLAGLPFAQADKDFPQRKDLPIHQALYGQESRLAFRFRAENALRSILHDNPGVHQLAMVSHGGMIQQLYAAFLGLPLDANHGFSTGDTGFHVWRIQEGQRIIVRANCQEHLIGL